MTPLLSHIPYHVLLDGAENRATVWIAHLDTNLIAKFQKRSDRVALPEHLDRALLSDA